MPSKYIPRLRKSPKDRFMEKVVKTDTCWNWNGAISAGYGNFMFNGKATKAHRVSYSLFVGEIKEIEGSDYRGSCVMHTCDNCLCVNPSHLVLGTHQDNMTDKKNKGRVISNSLFGEHHQNSKLKSEDIPEIRYLKSLGATFQQIAEIFGVNRATIHRIIIGDTWVNA